MGTRTAVLLVVVAIFASTLISAVAAQWSGDDPTDAARTLWGITASLLVVLIITAVLVGKDEIKSRRNRKQLIQFPGTWHAYHTGDRQNLSVQVSFQYFDGSTMSVGMDVVLNGRKLTWPGGMPDVQPAYTGNSRFAATAEIPSVQISAANYKLRVTLSVSAMLDERIARVESRYVEVTFQ